MTAPAIGTAPGKVVLFGEHSVVYGEPAIAAAIDRRLQVIVRERTVAHPEDISTGPSSEAIARVAKRFGVSADALAVRASSSIPMGCGLGSSAAFGLALVRAFAAFTRRSISDAEAAEHAADVESVFHGTSSGLDVAAAASGGVIWFQRSGRTSVTELSLPGPVDLVVGLSGESRGTSAPVGRLRERYERYPMLYGRLIRMAGDFVRSARTALIAGNWEFLGSLMNVAHGLLNALAVSTPTLERMVTVARAAGAVGAKLTGAGGGGAIIALAPDRAEAVASALAGEGFESFVERLGGEKGGIHGSKRRPSS